MSPSTVVSTEKVTAPAMYVFYGKKMTKKWILIVLNIKEVTMVLLENSKENLKRVVRK